MADTVTAAMLVIGDEIVGRAVDSEHRVRTARLPYPIRDPNRVKAGICLPKFCNREVGIGLARDGFSIKEPLIL